jgi:signal transduction histidine kinase
MFSIRNRLTSLWRRTALRQALAVATTVVAILALIWIVTYFQVRDELRAVNPEAAEEALEIVNEAFLFAFLAITAAALAMGTMLGIRAQIRVDRISSTLNDVAQGKLTARTKASPSGDDLDYVGARIDATLDELQRVMRRMRDLSANVAHDLRTPVAQLRADLEDALLAAEEDRSTVAKLGTALEKTDQLTALIDAIMRIAHVESGARRAAFAPVKLADLCQTVADTFAPVVEESGRNFVLTLDSSAEVTGDHDLLVQLIANLIQNAVRHTPGASTVRLSARGRCITVCDDGPGVPASERKRILEPNYRLDKSRNTEGIGLGLTLVAAVAELHEANLTLTENPAGTGLCVSVSFQAETRPGPGRVGQP